MSKTSVGRRRTPRWEGEAGTRKAQVLLSPEQYQLLESYAREQGKSVSTLVRESLERTLLAALRRRQRESALRRLCGQQLPVDDWETMERELEARWDEQGIA